MNILGYAVTIAMLTAVGLPLFTYGRHHRDSTWGRAMINIGVLFLAAAGITVFVALVAIVTPVA
jgi:hypothetical protein